MTVKIHSTIVIDRPVDEVFPFFVDIERSAPQIDPTVKSVIKEPEGPIEVGTTFRLSQLVMGKLRDTTTRYTGIEPNRRLEFEAELGPVRSFHGVVTFDPVDGGTRVTFHGEGKLVGMFKLLAGRIQRIGNQAWDRRFAGLKKVLEAEAPKPCG